LPDGLNAYYKRIENWPDFEIYNSDKILEVNDLAEFDIESRAIKVIEFNHDYSNCPNPPNTLNNVGKLNLNSVKVKGKNGIMVLPPYTFEYYNPTIAYSKNRIDPWGFDANNPINYNLKKIITPTGAKLKINYEADSYSATAAKVGQIVSGINLTLKETNHKYKKLQNSGSLDLTQIFSNGDYIRISAENLSKVLVWFPIFGRYYPFIKKVDYEPRYHEITQVTSNSLTFYPEIDLGCLPPPSGIQQICNYLINPEIEFTKLNKRKYEVSGGGLRVASIEIKSENNQTLSKTKYSYNIPNTTISSGVTSYAPVDKNEDQPFIPYENEVPLPNVNYEYVKVETFGKTNLSNGYQLYQFETLSAITNSVNSDFNENGEYEIGDYLKVTNSQNTELNAPTPPVYTNIHSQNIKARSAIITNKLSAIGRPISTSSFNINDQLLTKSEYTYAEAGDYNDIGKIKEVFGYKKAIFERIYRGTPWMNHPRAYKWFFTNSGKVSYPSILKQIIESSNGLDVITTYDSLDFITGNVLITKTIEPNGRRLKTKSIPAYTIYPEMGSKVTNPSYPNMLTQEAASYTYLLDNLDNEVGVLGAGAQTWNKTWNYRHYVNGTYTDVQEAGIWRKHQTYSWNGELNSNGTYKSPFAEFDFNGSNSSNWIKSNEISRYSHYSVPMEAMDINNNFAASRIDEEMKTIATVANANYRSFFHSNFETESITADINHDYDGIIISSSDMSSCSTAHSGKYGMEVFANKVGPTFITTTGTNGLQTGRTYRASVWMYSQTPVNTNATLNFQLTGSVSDADSKNISDATMIVDNWHLLEITFEVPENYVSSGSSDGLRVFVSNTSGSTPVIIDDLRLCPIDAAMNAYVYDEDTGAVTAIIDNNNFATFYEYNDAGHLIKVFKETQNGVKKISEYRHNFARDLE
jgi:hypothetical protein